MSEEGEKQQKRLRGLMSRRVALLLGLQFAGIYALAKTARKLQVDEQDRYRLLAENNSLDLRLERAPRGIIYDTTGRRIADNIPNFMVTLNKTACPDPEHTLYRLSKLVEIAPTKYLTLLQKIEGHKENAPITLVEHLDWPSFALVGENLPSLPGCNAQIALSRIYPYHELFAHEVGYLGKVSDYDLEKRQLTHPIYRTDHAVVGKTGVEMREEEALRAMA